MMELPKLTQKKLEKFSNLKFNHNFPIREAFFLKSLQNDNVFIKKKLAEFESRLDMFPIATSYDKFKSQSINVNKNEQMESAKPRKIKSARQVKRIDAFLTNQPPIIEHKETDDDLKLEMTKNDFKIPEKTFTRLNSSRSARPNSSRPDSSRRDNIDDLLAASRLRSAQTPRTRLPSARNVNSNLSSRLDSARTMDTFSTTDDSTRTNDSTLDKIDQVIDHLKKHRRSALRKQKVEENIQRPKTTNSIIKHAEDKPESAKKKTRSKSARKSAKKEQYEHKFYSNSWRIHSEFMTEELDRKAPWDNTTSLFYKTNRKVPETFIFAPDWI